MSGRAALLVLGACLVLAWPGASWAANLDDLLFMGADYHYRGELDKAADTFAKVLAADPGNEFAMNQLALVQAKRERYDEAEALFARVAEASPDNTFARLWLGVLRLRAGDARAALARFGQVLDLDAANADAYYFLGVMYAVEHNPSRAVEFLQKAQAVSRDDPEIHHRLAKAFLGLDMAANAELELTRTLELNPRHLQALNDLGWLYYNSGRRSLALDAWRQALALDPAQGEARSNLAKVYNEEAYAMRRAGDQAGALGLWRKVLEVDPANKAARYYLR